MSSNDVPYPNGPEWLNSVDRSSREFLMYCEGRWLARQGILFGSEIVKEYVDGVAVKRGKPAADDLRRLGQLIFQHESVAVLDPLPPPEIST